MSQRKSLVHELDSETFIDDTMASEQPPTPEEIKQNVTGARAWLLPAGERVVLYTKNRILYSRENKTQGYKKYK